VIEIILYLSGNFPQLSDINKEREMAKYCENKGSGYHRLMTFFYQKDCNTILTVGREIVEDIKPTLIKRGERIR
jgi:hypothetical protein